MSPHGAALHTLGTEWGRAGSKLFLAACHVGCDQTGSCITRTVKLLLTGDLSAKKSVQRSFTSLWGLGFTSSKFGLFVFCLLVLSGFGNWGGVVSRNRC